MMHVSAFVFDGKKTAGKALETLDAEAPGARRWVDDVAVISRSKHGNVRVSSTWAQNEDATAAGAGFGAITGGLIGSMMGPQGALFGALGGGTIYGLMGTGFDHAVEDPRLEEMASRMKDDSSSLVLVADEPTAADFVSAVEPYDATLIETDLNEHDVKALRELLKASEKRA